MQVGRLLEEDEELVLVDGSHLTEAAVEGSLLNWLDDGPHSDRVVILVHHDWSCSSPPDMPSGDSSRFERDSLGDLGNPDHLDSILISEHLEGVKLDLQHETEGLVVFEEDQVTRTVHLGD